MSRLLAPEPVRRIACRLRAEPSPAERALWNLVRDRRTAGLKFRRQVAIGPFVVDFLCIRMRLVVEIDGEIHRFQKKRDDARTEALQSLGYTVLRFSNEQVLNDPRAVLMAIEAAARR